MAKIIRVNENFNITLKKFNKTLGPLLSTYEESFREDYII